jgi:hypothetical protein
MNTVKHTPGPWYVHGPTIVGGIDCCDIPYGVAHVLNPYAGTVGASERVTANARLIAAAPDMLASLEDLIKAVENFVPLAEEWPELAMARTAITKATTEQQ